LLASAILLEQENLAGVWAVLTAWEPELIPEQELQSEIICNAVALALVPRRPAWVGPKIAVRPCCAPREESLPEFGITNLLSFLEAGESGPPRQAWLLADWGEVEFERGLSLPAPSAGKSTSAMQHQRLESTQAYMAGRIHGD
jgi:hypothetical protein